MSIIYKTTNLINGKIYVGQHYTSANDGYLGSGITINKAKKKYGTKNFKREILEHCKPDEVNEREIYWIDKLIATNPEIVYNISFGGEGGAMKGRNHSSESKNKISKGNTNKKMSKESKLKLRILRLCKKLLEETKNKISNAIRGENNPNNKYIYNLSNGEKYWDLNKNERIAIRRKFLRKQTDSIEYRGIDINRVRKH